MERGEIIDRKYDNTQTILLEERSLKISVATQRKISKIKLLKSRVQEF